MLGIELKWTRGLSGYQTSSMLLIAFLLLDCASSTQGPRQSGVTDLATGVVVTESQEPMVGSSLGQRAPDFRLEALDGTTLTVQSYENRPLILYFFATW